MGDVGTAIAGAFNAAVDQAREVAGKIQSAMQAGGAVLVNGVLTVYSKVLTAADPAIAGLVDLAERAWSFATSCFGFC